MRGAQVLYWTLAALFGACAGAALVLLTRRRTPSPAEKPPDDRPAMPEVDAGESTDAADGPERALPDMLIDPAVRIEKSSRTLTIFSAGEAVKTYRVALSGLPGAKRSEGDKRTPEGSYYVCTRNERSKHVRFLGLSYPDIDDADVALSQGRISARDHRSIATAIRRMQRPPWKTALGGEIGIHGGGADRDWTLGCIALDDRDALELFAALPMGTPVEIVP